MMQLGTILKKRLELYMHDPFIDRYYSEKLIFFYKEYLDETWSDRYHCRVT